MVREKWRVLSHSLIQFFSKFALKEKWTKITSTDLGPVHLTLSGYKGGGYLAKEGSQPLTTIFWLVECSRSWMLPGISLLFWKLHRMTSAVQMNRFKYFKQVPIFETSILILIRDFPLECIWMIQNNRTGYPRTGGSFQSTIGGTLQYPAFFICISGLKRLYQYIIGKPFCIPPNNFGSTCKEYCSSKPTSTHIKTPLKTQEPPCCWLDDHFQANQPYSVVPRWKPKTYWTFLLWTVL